MNRGKVNTQRHSKKLRASLEINIIIIYFRLYVVMIHVQQDITCFNQQLAHLFMPLKCCNVERSGSLHPVGRDVNPMSNKQLAYFPTAVYTGHKERSYACMI